MRDKVYRVVPRLVALRTFTYALHTYSRGLSAAQEGPQLGSRPVRLGHVALGGWFDVRTRHRLRARRSPAASRHRGGHRMHGTCSSVPARHRQAKPRGKHREVVHQQRSAASCRTRTAGCGQAALCASGSGGEWERCLVGRCGSAEQHGEHRQDGAEACKPWQPSLAAGGAHTPTSPMDGRCCASSGPLSRPRAAAPELADAIRVRPHVRTSHEQVASAELVERWRTRGAPPRDATGERFVPVSSQPLAELPYG